MTGFADDDDAPTLPRPLTPVAPQAVPRPAARPAQQPAARGANQPPRQPEPFAAPQRIAQPRAAQHGAEPRRASASAFEIDPKRGNALIQAAGRIFGIVIQLGFAGGHPDTEALQRSILADLNQFEGAAYDAGYPEETVTAAKYVLATALDEAVLDTAWGFESIWGSRSLLSVLFRETWGGEKLFAILERLKADPARNIDMLELIDLALSLGFQGKYRTIEGGLYQLEDLRLDLYRLCRSIRPGAERELAPHRQAAAGGLRLRRFVPAWVGFVVALVALIGTFLWLQDGLQDASRPTLRALDFIADSAGSQPILPPRPVEPPIVIPPPPAPVAAPTPAPAAPTPTRRPTTPSAAKPVR